MKVRILNLTQTINIMLTTIMIIIIIVILAIVSIIAIHITS